MWTFGVTGSGIMLADEQNVPHYVAASDGPGRMLEVVESDTGQGACAEAFVNNTVVASTDMTTEGRWPDLARRSARTAYALSWAAGAPGWCHRRHSRRVLRPSACGQEDECQALARYRDVVESTSPVPWRP